MDGWTVGTGEGILRAGRCLCCVFLNYIAGLMLPNKYPGISIELEGDMGYLAVKHACVSSLCDGWGTVVAIRRELTI